MQAPADLYTKVLPMHTHIDSNLHTYICMYLCDFIGFGTVLACKDTCEIYYQQTNDLKIIFQKNIQNKRNDIEMMSVDKDKY